MKKSLIRRFTTNLNSKSLNIKINNSIYNIPESILAKSKYESNQKLYNKPNHPINILSSHIYEFFKNTYPDIKYIKDMDPVVTRFQNFDSLNIEIDHVSRSTNDTYYFNEDQLLRTQSSAHQNELIPLYDNFLLVNDVYRRDTVDKTHYPVFHQMEGVKLWDKSFFGIDYDIDFGAANYKEIIQKKSYIDAKKFLFEQLKTDLYNLSIYLFCDKCAKNKNDLEKLKSELKISFVDAYFPFTHPSFEIEVYSNGIELELLGAGVIHDNVMKMANRPDKLGYAFGLGLERIAMKMFTIPDVRLFWSNDERFLKQFNSNKKIHEMQFEEFSKYPNCYKDVSFWVPADFVENEFFETVREIADFGVESIDLIDEYTNKEGRSSKAYRINYRSMDRTLSNEEVNKWQMMIREELIKKGYQIR